MHNHASKINTAAKLGVLNPSFTALDHAGQSISLSRLMGELGLLLAFVNDISLSTTIRRALWLQSNLTILRRLGVKVALVVPNQPHTLANFYSSSPVPPEFTLLADEDRELHRLFQLNHRAGLVLIARDRQVIAQWAVPEEKTWPDIIAITRVAQTL